MMLFKTKQKSRSDLQHHHEEEIEIGSSVELLEQRQGQEGQGGVFMTVHRVALPTQKRDNRGVREESWDMSPAGNNTGMRGDVFASGWVMGGASYCISPPLEAEEGFLLSGCVEAPAVCSRLPCETWRSQRQFEYELMFSNCM